MKIKSIIVFVLVFQLLTITSLYANSDQSKSEMIKKDPPLSLITKTPEEGFQLAVKLARKGVKTTQPDKEVLFMLREVYSRDADSLIACSQVIAIYFQTVAAANNYWRE
jgi:hypothetical protein